MARLQPRSRARGRACHASPKGAYGDLIHGRSRTPPGFDPETVITCPVPAFPGPDLAAAFSASASSASLGAASI